MADFNSFCERFMRTLRTCHVACISSLGINQEYSSIDIPVDYGESALFWIADYYQRSIGFTNLIAYKGIDGTLKAVRLCNAAEKAVSISERLGMIYGAPYKKIVRKGDDVIYYI